MVGLRGSGVARPCGPEMDTLTLSKGALAAMTLLMLAEGNVRHHSPCGCEHRATLVGFDSLATRPVRAVGVE